MTTTIWSRVSRFRMAVGLAVSVVLISGMAAASLSGAGVPRAYADPYKDLTAAQTSQANVRKKLAGVNSDLQQTVLQLNDLVNNQIPAAEDASNSAQDTASKAQQTAQEAAQRLAAAKNDRAALEERIRQTGIDYDDSKAAVAQSARESFHSSASGQIMNVVTKSKSADSFIENMQTNSAVARVEANEADDAAHTLSASLNRRQRLEAIEQRVSSLKQQADSASAAAQSAADQAQQKAAGLARLQEQSQQKQAELTAMQSQLTTQEAREAVAVLQAQQAVEQYNRQLAAQRAAEQARAAQLAAQQYNAEAARRAAAQRNTSGSSSQGRNTAPAVIPAPANPGATARGMNYSVPGNCSATATTCYGHATGRTSVLGGAYPWSQCTWWAYIRRTQLALPVGSYLGNGGEWASKAAALGYYVNNTPHVGAAVSFLPGQVGSSPVYGHVAVVERVNANGTILISECGAKNHGRILTRILGNAGSYRYIHY